MVDENTLDENVAFDDVMNDEDAVEIEGLMVLWIRTKQRV